MTARGDGFVRYPLRAALVLLGLMLISDPSLRFLVSILAAALFSAIAFVVGEREWKGASRLRLVALALAVGALAGLATSAQSICAVARSTGLPLESIVRVSGVATEDSTTAAAGDGLVSLVVDSVAGRDGLAATARFPLAVVARGGVSAPRGARLSATGTVLRSPRDGSYRLIAPPGGVTVKPMVGLAALRAAIRRAALDGLNAAGDPARGLLAALLLGYRDELDTAEVAAFRAAGLPHVLALSGMHLAVLAGLVSFLARRALGKRGALLVSLGFVGAYLFIVGGQPSLLRAGLMYGALAASSLLDRRRDALVALALAFIVLVVASPESFTTASFQLSFLAMLGILLFAKRIGLRLRRRLPPALAELAGASVAAQLAVMPLIASMFGSIQPFAALAGIAIAPLVTCFLWAGALWLALYPLSALPVVAPLVEVARCCVTWLYRATMSVVDFFAGAPSLSGVGWGGVACAGAVLVSVGLLLYAGDLRYGYSRFRFADGAQAPSRRARPHDAEKVRSELSHQSTRQAEDRRAA